MRKSVLFSSVVAVFLAACSSELSQDVVKKYESALNSSLNELKTNYNNEAQKLEISDFACESDGEFLQCESSGAKFFDGGTELLSVAKISFRTNEVYTQKEQGLISYKAYYDALFKDKDKLETSLNVDGLKLSGEFSQNMISFASLSGDEKLISMASTLLNDTYKLDAKMTNLKSGEKLNYEVNYALASSGASRIDFSLNGDFSNSGFDFIDNELKLKFDTNKLSMDESGAKSLEEGFEFKSVAGSPLFRFLDFVSLNNTNLKVSLDTKDALKPYLAMAGGYLNLNKNKAKTESEALLFDKASVLLDELSKDPIYKLDINAKLKNVAFKDYEKEGVGVIEKLEINKQDFTDALKLAEDLDKF